MDVGVGQLAFTFNFPALGLASGLKDGAEAAQGDHPDASAPPVATGNPPPRKRKWHSLIDKVYALPNLQLAWERVRANQGAAGGDGITIAQFTEHAGAWLQQLSQDLPKTYQPQPVRRVLIAKPGGGQRPLGIPTVRDRIVQQALLQILAPIFEAKFSARSHGFRPERGCHTALAVVDQAIRHGYTWVVDADLQNFFDTVDHDLLLDAVNAEVADGSVLRLIRRILQAGVRLPDVRESEPTTLGTPQGSPLSPLLANVYLHAFDVEMTAAGYGLVRYADDFVVFAKSEGEAQAALELARQLLEGPLRLVLHPEKTRVVSVAHGFEFLGYHYFHDAQRGVLRKEVRGKSAQRFRTAIRLRTRRLQGQRKPKPRHLTVSRLQRNARVQAVIRSVNRYLDGWHGYFRGVWSPFANPFQFQDQFVRRRVRSVITGRIGTGWWQCVLSNRVLRQVGLISLAERYAEYRQSPQNTPGSRAVPTRKGNSGGEPYAGNPHVRFGKAGGQVTAP